MPRLLLVPLLLISLSLLVAGCRSSGGTETEPAAVAAGSADDAGQAPLSPPSATATAETAQALLTMPGGTSGSASTTAVPADEAADLRIVSHQQATLVDQSTVVIGGFSEPGSTVRVGETAALMEPDGRWSVELTLDEGANLATFHATDAAGNETSQALVLHYEKPPPPPAPAAHDKADGHASSDPQSGTPEPSAHAFSAHQRYGSCGEELPYDVFSGSASPGTTVRVLSDYGSGEVVADASGHWELTVFFPSAPSGKSFDVKVTDGSQHKRFGFIYIA